jgi:hypothetical protein
MLTSEDQIIADTELPQPKPGSEQQTDAAPNRECSTGAAINEATETEVVNELCYEISSDSPVDVGLLLHWAREATWVGLAGPKDPGTLPGVMAFKRPPRAVSEPMARPRPD